VFFVLEIDCTNGSKLAVIADRPEDFASHAGEAGRLRLIDGLAPGYTLAEALSVTLRTSDAPLVAVLANPNIVIDPELPLRLDRAVADVGDPGAAGVITSRGCDRWGNTFSALYASAEPQLPFCRTSVPVVDSASDLFIISRQLVKRLLERGSLPPVESLAGWAILEGYLDGMVSWYSPHLAAGLYGHHLARGAERHSYSLCRLIGSRIIQTSLATLDGQTVLGDAPAESGDARDWHLAARVDLDRQIAAAILPHCTRLSLSVITRTQFSRAHLLRRLLTSLSRWRSDDVDMEIVLSTDIDREHAERELADLRLDFPALHLVLAWNGERRERSRVRNLLGGIATATGSYVAFIDDDDHLHFKALPILSTIRFRGSMPALFMDTELRKERWLQAGDDRWILESSVANHSYPGKGWRTMFRGVNQLPICSGILPREWLLSHVERFEFRHDYSEDFTLFLLLLQTSDLPLVLDVPRPFCVVSIRDDGTNTVTEEDRSGWVRDITMFLHDLHIANSLNGEGRLQSLIEIGSLRVDPVPPPLPVADDRIRRELAVARLENDALRTRLADIEIRDLQRQDNTTSSVG